MSDFTQNGVVCTLQRLNTAHLDELDRVWLPPLSEASPVTIILPCHAPDLRGPALAPICRDLAHAPWLRQLLIPINGLPPSKLPEVRAFFKTSLPNTRHLVFQTDTPDLTRILAQGVGLQPAQLPSGKGLNVWVALGLLFASNNQGIVTLQDCDVLSFQRASLARLAFALADPNLGFDFAKMYYSRVTDRLYGRVSRLFLSPLLHALIHVAGHHPLLDFLQSFRYPLSGECSVRSDLAARLPFSNGWALEIGMLSSIFRQIDASKVCQVDGGSDYDHKHQPATGSLSRMCTEIGNALLLELQTEGCALSPAFLKSVSSALRKESMEAVRRSDALSRINGLIASPEEESEMACAFANCIPLIAPPPTESLPAWDQIQRSSPTTLQALLETADASGHPIP
ncbi:MAG: hypothetical protein WCO60_07395 [Verrucomicrobiota bacterium]